MTNTPLDPDVRRLIDRHLSSIEQIEVLLCLFARPGEPMDADTVAECMSTRVDAVIADLRRLRQHGFLSYDAGTNSYAYSVRDEATNDALSKIARMYESEPVTLVRAVYERPAADVRSFADAFRLRRS